MASVWHKQLEKRKKKKEYSKVQQKEFLNILFYIVFKKAINFSYLVPLNIFNFYLLNKSITKIEVTI